MRTYFRYFYLSVVLMCSLSAVDRNYLKSIPSLVDEQAPYVMVECKGQLGNQLYQAATGISLAIDNNARYIHQARSYREFFEPFYFKVPQTHDYIFSNVEKNGYDNTKNHIDIKYKDNMLLKGYFLSYKYFDHNKDHLTKIFAPSHEIKERILNKHGKLFNNTIVVGLHIRTFIKDAISSGNPRAFYKKFPSPNMHYILSAISRFPSDAIFLVSSDNIKWAKKALAHVDRKFVFSAGDLVEDFYLLTKCDHLIIGNSSFSWWAAYLNGKTDSRIIAPWPYALDPKRKIQDTYPPEWEIIYRKEDGKTPI